MGCLMQPDRDGHVRPTRSRFPVSKSRSRSLASLSDHHPRRRVHIHDDQTQTPNCPAAEAAPHGPRGPPARLRDPEDELALLRKKRTRLQLQRQIATERQRFQDDRQSLPTSVPTPPEDPAPLYLPSPEASAAEGPVRGIKRSRSESMELVTFEDDGGWVQYCESGRSLPVTTIFEGTSRKEFNSFKRKLAEQFSALSLFFQHDRYKVLEALRHVSRSLADRWALHSQRTGDESWLGFHSFLDHQLPFTRYTPVYVESLYRKAKQRQNQSVHEFMRYLSGLEAAMPQLFDEADRSLKLWNGTLPEICQVSELHPNDDTFHAFVESLERAEASLPDRLRALGAPFPREDGRTREIRNDVVAIKAACHIDEREEGAVFA